jgi:hypothetical protein
MFFIDLPDLMGCALVVILPAFNVVVAVDLRAVHVISACVSWILQKHDCGDCTDPKIVELKMLQ